MLLSNSLSLCVKVVLAIIIGLILGGIILFGIKIANQSAKEAAAPTTPSGQIASLPHSGRRQSNLSLTEPINHAVVNTSSVKISGKTLPASAIAIGEADDALLTADGDGNFTTDFKLSGGENLITVTVLLPDQKIETVDVSVVYSTAKLSYLTTADPTDVPIATDSQTIVEKTYEDVLQKAKDNGKQTEVLDAKADRNRLVGYAGAITDIKQGVFSLDSRGNTLQVSYDTKTTIIKEGSPSTRTSRGRR